MFFLSLQQLFVVQDLNRHSEVVKDSYEAILCETFLRWCTLPLLPRFRDKL